MANTPQFNIEIEINDDYEPNTYSATFSLSIGEIKSSVAFINLTNLSKFQKLIEAIKSNKNYCLILFDSVMGDNTIRTNNGKTSFVATKWVNKGNSVSEMTIPNKEALPLIEKLANTGK